MLLVSEELFAWLVLLSGGRHAGACPIGSFRLWWLFIARGHWRSSGKLKVEVVSEWCAHLLAVGYGCDDEDTERFHFIQHFFLLALSIFFLKHAAFSKYSWQQLVNAKETDDVPRLYQETSTDKSDHKISEWSRYILASSPLIIII